MWYQHRLHGLLALHYPDRFIGLIQREGVGDESFEILGSIPYQLKRHMGMFYIACPYSLEGKIFTIEVMKTVKFYGSVRFPESC